MVSIIIPVYNVRSYIKKCLESVVSQTYIGSMECLIIDDCGQDDSISIAKEFISDYNGSIDFRIIHHVQNKGLSGARNTGIRESRGNWLYFLDSDDWITPDCIQTMKGCTERHPDVEMVQGGVFSNNKDIENWFSLENKPLTPEFSDNPDWINAQTLTGNPIFVTVWNKLLSKQFIVKHSLYCEEGMLNEDELWSFMLSKVLTKVSFTKTNTYFYNIREGSIIGNKEKMLLNYPRLIRYKILNIGGQYSARETMQTAKFILKYESESVTKQQKCQYILSKIRLVFKAPRNLRSPLLKIFFSPIRTGKEEFFNYLHMQIFKC